MMSSSNNSQTPLNHIQMFLNPKLSGTIIPAWNTREIRSFPSTEDPKIVFFPANQGASSSDACQDEISTEEHSGFNTFAFLSFALTVFNVMR